jgi:hypothetical protein
VDTEQFGNFSDEDGSRSNSQDGEEISFLAKDRNQQKVSCILIFNIWEYVRG